jgi:CheY-like chemotaxis protein
MSTPFVLIAEDDPDLRELVVLTLRDAGIDVDEAGDGCEALARIVERKPDLVLLDMMMPVMDGFGFADALRAMDQPPPVLVMTAADHAAQSARKIGAVGWLAKPFDIDALVKTVSRCLEKCELLR